MSTKQEQLKRLDEILSGLREVATGAIEKFGDDADFVPVEVLVSETAQMVATIEGVLRIAKALKGRSEPKVQPDEAAAKAAVSDFMARYNKAKGEIQ